MYPSKLTFQPNLNHLDWTSESKVMPKILTDVQAGILIRIGLGFGVNFLWFLAPIGLTFNWVDLLLNSCLAGCKLAWFNWPSSTLHIKSLLPSTQKYYIIKHKNNIKVRLNMYIYEYFIVYISCTSINILNFKLLFG